MALAHGCLTVSARSSATVVPLPGRSPRASPRSPGHDHALPSGELPYLGPGPPCVGLTVVPHDMPFDEAVRVIEADAPFGSVREDGTEGCGELGQPTLGLGL